LNLPDSWSTVGAAERVILAATHPLPAERPSHFFVDADPARVLTVANQNKVVPRTWAYLAATLEISGRGDWRDLERLAEQIQREAARRHLLTLGLVRTLELGGVETLPFKGTLLSEQLYGNAVLRQSSDVDLLVRPESFPRALELLHHRGYRVTRPAVMPEVHRLTWLLDEYTDYNVQLYSPADDLFIELHWRLTSDQRFPLENTSRFWQRLVIRRSSGRDVRAFSDPDLLLYLAVHGVKDHWRRLSWLADFAWLATHSRASVELARARAREAGLETTWAAASELVQRWYGLPMRAAIGQRARYLADHASLLQDDPLVIRGGALRYHWMSHDSWAARMQAIAQAYLTPGTWSVRSSRDYNPTRRRVRLAGHLLRRLTGK
jgi:hypothetical protein